MKLAPWVLLGALNLWGCQGQNQTSPYSTPVAEQTTSNTSIAVTTSTPATSPTPEASETPGPKGSQKLEPLPGAKAPKITKVVKARFKTTRGDLIIEIYPEAAPNAAGRFIELVKMGFYDKTPIFRVVPGFVAQFGINSKPKLKDYMDKNFKDDPSHFKLLPGTLAFAKAGKDTNSTQVFINYGDNSQLVMQGGFTAFAKITKGFEKTPDFKAIGDPSMGLDQGALRNDTEGYLKSLPEKPDMIEKAEILK